VASKKLGKSARGIAEKDVCFGPMTDIEVNEVRHERGPRQLTLNLTRYAGAPQLLNLHGPHLPENKIIDLVELTYAQSRTELATSGYERVQSRSVLVPS
jgi:hypothetical protein